MTKTFKQFLEEEKKTLSFKELLHGECRDLLKRSQQNGLIIRGVNGYGTTVGMLDLGEGFEGVVFSIFKKKVRKERKPMDTIPELHRIVDDWFEEEMGIRARSEAVFCFGESGRKNASEYGSLAVILPIGKFTYVWSPEVADLYEDVLKKLQTHNREIRPAYVGPTGKPDVEAIHEVMNKLGYTINGFDKACQAAVEIMIDCDEYYVIPLAHDHETQEKQLGIIKKAFVQA